MKYQRSGQMMLADKGCEGVLTEKRPLSQGLNIIDGTVTNRAVKKALGAWGGQEKTPWQCFRDPCGQ